jgi:hypothetical protein
MPGKNIKLSTLKPNTGNPRFIKDEKFKKLCESIKQFPRMMELRPIILDENNIILGGNMRFTALKELGYKDVPPEWVKYAEGLTEEQKQEFIIKDNVGFGDWDWDILANEWDALKLAEWGLDVWKPSGEVDLDSFFADDSDSDKEEKFKITLEYTEEEYNLVIEAFKNKQGSKEQVVFKLLGL